MSDHANAPYYKILGWLTLLTLLEIFWAGWFVEARGLLVAGLALMAGIKAAMVALYYMHLKYEGKLLWAVIIFPLILVVVMISGFLPDAASPYGM